MTALLPLYGPNASGKASIVDDDIAAWAARWRWRLYGKGYVGRGIYVPTKGRYRIGYLHRIVVDCPVGLMVDHINGDPLDNRRENLRVVTQGENNQNQNKARASKTGFRNVYRCECGCGDFYVKFNLNGKYRRVGQYPTLDEAVTAASEARRQFMPSSPDARHFSLIHDPRS